MNACSHTTKSSATYTTTAEPEMIPRTSSICAWSKCQLLHFTDTGRKVFFRLRKSITILLIYADETFERRTRRHKDRVMIHRQLVCYLLPPRFQATIGGKSLQDGCPLSDCRPFEIATPL